MIRRGTFLGAVAALGLACVAHAQVVTPSPVTVAGTGTTPGSGNFSPPAEQVANAIDNDPATKYLNFGGTAKWFSSNIFPGLIVTPASGPSTLTGLQFTTANDANDRDPATVALFGTNDPIPTGVMPFGTISADWQPIYSGVTGLATDPGRKLPGATINFTPTTAGAFSSYELLVTSVRSATETCCTQFSEISLLGSGGTNVLAKGDPIYAVQAPEPATIGLLSLGAAGLLVRRRHA